MTRQDLRRQGEETLQRLFGTTQQQPGFANLLTEPVFGGVWNRPGLALPDRMLCVIAALGTGPRLRPLPCPRRRFPCRKARRLRPFRQRLLLRRPQPPRPGPP